MLSHSGTSVWLWMYNPLLHLLYQKSGNMWRKWIRGNRRGKVGAKPIFKYECNAIRLPSTEQNRLLSDKSIFPSSKSGAAAWILKSPNSSYICYGKLQFSGDQKIQSAYHSKLIGITALMIEILQRAREHSIVSNVTIGCDNEGAVKKLNNIRAPVSNDSHHFDLFQNIQHIIRLSQFQFSFYWIQISQDNIHDLHELP